jgi:hypothetical protein
MGKSVVMFTCAPVVYNRAGYFRCSVDLKLNCCKRIGQMILNDTK